MARAAAIVVVTGIVALIALLYWTASSGCGAGRHANLSLGGLTCVEDVR